MTPGALAAPGLVNLNATASDDDGTIARVSFYVNGGKILDVATAPYTRRTTRRRTRSTSSRPSRPTTRACRRRPPTSTCPSARTRTSRRRSRCRVSQTQISFPGTVTMTATASDDDGTIARVRFYQNGTLRKDVTTRAVHVQLHDDGAGHLQVPGGRDRQPRRVDVDGRDRRDVGQRPAAQQEARRCRSSLSQHARDGAGDDDADGQRVRHRRHDPEGPVLPQRREDRREARRAVHVHRHGHGNGQVAYHADATDNVGNVGTTLPQVVSAHAAEPVAVSGDADVWRLLNQATFGASQAEAAARQVARHRRTGSTTSSTSRCPATRTTRYNKIQLNETADCTTRDPLGNNYPANSPQAHCVRDHLSLAMMQRDFFTNGRLRGRTSCASAWPGRCRRSS